MAGSLDKFLGGYFDADQAAEVGIGGFTTIAVISQSVSRSRDIPTSFVEDGSSVNDHIIRQPRTISISGEVSDINIAPNPLLELDRRIDSELGFIDQFLPPWLQSQIDKVQSVLTDFNRLSSVVDAALNNSGRIGGLTGLRGGVKSNVQSFIDAMEGVMASDALITISDPIQSYENMALTLFEYEWTNEKKSAAFRIEAQEFRLAETIFVEVQPVAPNPAPGLGGQSQSVSDKGAQEGKEVPDTSFLGYLLGGDDATN